MRFYQPRTQFYCGVDLHARNMYICVIDQEGTIHKHCKLRCDPKSFLKAIEPFRDELTVSCECMFAWYWLADLCAAEAIEFVLGHALYMRTIHQGKTKNDKIDSEKIARLTQSGVLPMAYVYPPELRGLRDLLRRRLRFVRTRAPRTPAAAGSRNGATISGPYVGRPCFDVAACACCIWPAPRKSIPPTMRRTSQPSHWTTSATPASSLAPLQDIRNLATRRALKRRSGRSARCRLTS